MEKKPYPSEIQDRFIVRLPDGMRDRIAAAAKDNNRSMNSEIVARLETTFQGQEPAGAAEQIAQFAKLVESLKQDQALTAAHVKRIADAMATGDAHLVPKGSLRMPKIKKAE